MRIHSIRVKNFGPFSDQEVILGPLATIVGQNDVGKSYILRALQVFFEQRKIERDDVYIEAGEDDKVVIEVAFTSLPDRIELEDGVETTFREEMLLDSEGYLRIRKEYPCSDLSRFDVSLITRDFQEDRFAGLPSLKESDLNKLCSEVGIEVAKSGRGITNKGKREDLRAKAREMGIPFNDKRELRLDTKSDLWKRIKGRLPGFQLFEAETSLDVEGSSFQKEFRPAIIEAIIRMLSAQSDVAEAIDAFKKGIGEPLQNEVNKIFGHLQQLVDTYVGCTVIPEISWEKAVTLKIITKDQQGVEVRIDQRGSGFRRLFMVAFFQYLAEKEQGPDYIFAVEEPENGIHPGLQRKMVESFRQLADKGHQVIVTTHSPIFAGASPIEDLVLIEREAGRAVVRGVWASNIDQEQFLSNVADQLGVKSSDQIVGYNAVLFVEGEGDVTFWRIVAKKFKECGYIEADFDDRKIGVIPVGGSNLGWWVNSKAIRRLNRRFAVVVDSDKKDQNDCVSSRKSHWKQECESYGGVFFITRKREIENYIHPRALQSVEYYNERYQKYQDYLQRHQACHDFTDMKTHFDKNVSGLIVRMSCDEILEMDRYEEGGKEHHELLEIVRAILQLGG